MDQFLTSIVAAMLSISGLFLTVLIWKLVRQIHHRFHHDTSQALYALFLFISPSKILVLSLVLAMVVGSIVAWINQNTLIILPFIIGSLLAPKFIISWFLKHRTKQIVQQLPNTIEAISLNMQAGMNFMNAFEMVVKEERPPISQEFSLVLKELKIGTSLEQALYRLENRIPVDAMKYLVSGVLISREVGGNLSEMLMSLSKTLRRILEVEQKVSALTAQGRFQAKVMTGLPLVLCLGLYALEPDAMSMLWNTQIGWGVLAISAIFLGLGYFSINKIISIKI